MTTKDFIIKTIRIHKSELTQFGIKDIGLFGSYAREEQSANSDIDILVSFNGAATSSRYFGLQFYLEDLLGHSIDLVTEKALRNELRPYIEQEAIRV